MIEKYLKPIGWIILVLIFIASLAANAYFYFFIDPAYREYKEEKIKYNLEIEDLKTKNKLYEKELESSKELSKIIIKEISAKQKDLDRLDIMYDHIVEEKRLAELERINYINNFNIDSIDNKALEKRLLYKLGYITE